MNIDSADLISAEVAVATECEHCVPFRGYCEI